MLRNLKKLTQKEIDVLVLRLRGFTLKEIGTLHGVQQERIRQIEAKALRRLGWNGHFYCSNCDAVNYTVAGSPLRRRRFARPVTV